MNIRHDQIAANHRTRLVIVGAAVSLLTLVPTARADQCYADTKLNVGPDYQSNVHQFGLGGTCTSSQQATGGNPTTYLRVDITVNNAPGPGQRSGVVCTHLLNGAVYDPSIDGEIVRICYEEWATMITGAGDVQATGPVIRQTDAQGMVRYYRAVPSLIVGVITSWERRAITLNQNDFSAIDPSDSVDGVDQSLHPDFSSQGSPLELGIFRTNNTNLGAPGFSRSAALDSWSITVISEPCPADLNHDGIVDFGDLLKLLASWNCTP